MPNRRSAEEIKRSFENAKKVMAHQKKREREKDVKWAIGALVVVGAFQILLGLYSFNRFGIIEAFAIDGGIGAGFIALSFYAKKNAIQALTIGLGAYVAIIVLASVLMGNSPFSGIFMKIFVIMTLLSGIRAAKKLPHKRDGDEELIDQLDDEL